MLSCNILFGFDGLESIELELEAVVIGTSLLGCGAPGLGLGLLVCIMVSLTLNDVMVAINLSDVGVLIFMDLLQRCPRRRRGGAQHHLNRT